MRDARHASDDTARLFAVGVHHHLAGRLEKAEQTYQAVLAADPDHAESLNLLGVVAAQSGRCELAIRHLGNAIAIHGQDPSFHNNLGEARRLQGRLPEAAQAFRSALALQPAYAEAHNNLGAALHALGSLPDALLTYHRALDLKPDYPEALNNLGAVHQERNEGDAAMMRYRQAIALRPTYAEAHSNLGTLLLSRGRFAEGWSAYEWRRKVGDAARSLPQTDQPEWRGEAIQGRTLLLFSEQGLGDAMQFARFATPIAARGATVIVETHPALARLLSTVDGVAHVVAKGQPLPPFDLFLSSMSAPFVLGTTLETIPAKVPYLHAAAAAIDAWSHRLAKLPGLKVGLVWSGAPRPNDPRNHAIDRRRSMALTEMAPLLTIPGVSFVSLQMGTPSAQLHQVPPDRRPYDGMAEVTDFADTAGMLSHLDLVISVDTAVAHLAGAMGKPVWILSRFDGCWRWLSDRDDSPWYPTARLFRQTEPGDWHSVIARVAAELALLAGQALPAGQPNVGSRPLTEWLGVKERPDAAANLARGLSLQTAGRPLEAEAAYRAALAVEPDQAMAHNNLGNALASQGRQDEAALSLRRAIALQPDYAEAYFNLGILLHRDGRLAEATHAYRTAQRLKPDFIEALTNLGAALQEQDRLDQALSVLRWCLALRPDDARTHLNLGVAMKSQGRMRDAVLECRRAIACEATDPLAHVNLAHALLLLGEFDEGWREYEWRWRGGVPGLVPRYPADSRWTGQELSGRTILLYAEQGLGDALQFVRYAALFAKRGATVVLEAHAPLVRLLSRQPGISSATAMGEALPAFDYHLPMMSAPVALGTLLDSIPAAVPYLTPDDDLVAAWRGRLAGRPGPKVGLVWAGDPRRHDYRLASADRRRSIALARLAPPLAVSGVSLVSLQKGPAAAQCDDLPAEMRPLDLMADVTDFADTAALVANLDLVISVDTSVVHLAGALGKPVWILCRFDGCWRWLADRQDSPWYPTARLFRQTSPGDWGSVIDRVAADLRRWVASSGCKTG